MLEKVPEVDATGESRTRMRKPSVGLHVGEERVGGLFEK